MAPNVKLMALMFMGPEGGSVSDAISAIGYAKNKGVKILNASWGYEGPPDRALKDAIGTSGMLFVTGAGNGGFDGVGDNNDTNPNNATYPASYDSPNILSVAAIDNKGNLAAFSNYGSTSVDIAAPGVDILGAVPGSPDRSAATLSSVGTSGKALVCGFGVEEIEGATNQASFMSQAFTAVGRGTEPVVLVDDDGSQAGAPDIGPTVSAAIQSATGATPETVDVGDEDGPNLAQLQGKTVVWATGSAFSSGPESTTLTGTDQQTLTNFLNDGGKLVLAGMDALYQIEDSSLVQNVLKLAVQGDSGTSEFAGAAGTGFAGESYDLTSTFATASYHDVVLPAPSSGTVVVTQGVYPGDAGSWALASGTSAAAPHAAGVAALAASTSPTLLSDPVALKNHLMNRGKAAPATVGKTVSGKMLDAQAAVSTDTTPPSAPTLDLVATSDSGSSSTDNITNDTTPTLTGTAEASSTIQVYDGDSQIGTTTASGTDAWSFTPASALADDAHPFKATATDAAGNVSAASAILSVTIDTAAPDTTIESGPSGIVGPNHPDFTFSSNEAGGTFECRLDGTVYEACPSPKSYAGLTEGSHTFQVRATDKAGNVDTSPAERTFTVDTTAPTVADKTPASDATGVARDANVVVTFSEAVRPATVTTSTFTLTKLSGTTSVEATVTYDTATNKATLDPAKDLDSEATYTANLKGGASGVKDLADNPLAADSSWTFAVTDYTPPTVTSVSPASGATGVPLATDVSATFSEEMDASTVSGSTFTLLEQGTTSPISATVSYDSTAKKAILDPTNNLASLTTYVATVKGGSGGVKDRAGNALATDKTWTFTTADTEAPAAPTIDLIASSDTGSSGTDNLTNDSTPTLSGNAEAGSTVKIKDGTALVGTVAASGAGAWSFTPTSALAEGAHQFSATATDAAGNQSAASVTLTVTIDTTAPAATSPSHALTAPTQLSASAVPVLISWSSATDASGIDRYELRQSTDGGTTFSGVSLSSQNQTNRSYTAMLAPGTSTYLFEVRAVDKAGNGSSTRGSGFKVVDFSETHSSVAYAGTGWNTGSSTNFFGGSVKFASASSKKATLTFTNAKQVGWVTTEGPARGKAKVSLYEGSTLLASVTKDAYIDPVQYRRLLYSKSGLDPTKTYKLVVEVLGTKNASSTGTRVDVDSFVIIR